MPSSSKRVVWSVNAVSHGFSRPHHRFVVDARLVRLDGDAVRHLPARLNAVSPCDPVPRLHQRVVDENLLCRSDMRKLETSHSLLLQDSIVSPPFDGRDLQDSIVSPVRRRRDSGFNSLSPVRRWRDTGFNNLSPVRRGRDTERGCLQKPLPSQKRNYRPVHVHRRPP